MGSGSSKAKSADGISNGNNAVSKSPKHTNSEDKRSKSGNLVKTEEALKSANKTNTKSATENNNANAVTNTVVARNGTIKQFQPSLALGQFESDTESEGDDISTVLEETRNNYNKQRVQNLKKSEETDYPETYAQRLQRGQYKQQPQGLIRQKTIYRDPSEWIVDEKAMDAGFDVSKFKEVNAGKITQPVNTSLKDIYSTGETTTTTHLERQLPDPDRYYAPPVLESTISLPHYDTSEEALLAEIEKEFDF